MAILKGGESSKSSEAVPPDPIFDSILTSNTVTHDLLLLENQIPLFVLEKLFSLIVNRIPDRPNWLPSVTTYVRMYFGNMMTPEDKPTNSSTTTSCCSRSWYGLSCCSRLLAECVLSICGNTKEEDLKATEKTKEANKNYCHVLHKLHDDYLPSETSKEESEFMPCAVDLDYAGVKFVAGTGENLFKVKFTESPGLSWWCCRARFEIPPLGIYDSIEPFLRNIIAFEQCHPNVSHHFTSYACLMDMLVNSEKDVEVLEKAGVIRNYLGAYELFNKLCKEVVVGESFFAGKCKSATEYSQRSWPKAMAYVRRKYFATPWTFVALCLAFIAFGMSVTQFIRSFVR